VVPSARGDADAQDGDDGARGRTPVRRLRRRRRETDRQALLDKSGARAVPHLDSGSIAYYDRLRTLALTAPESEVRALPLLDRLGVLRLRHTFPPESLRGASGTDLLVLAVNEGFIGKESVEKAELGRIEVNGGEARAQLTASGKPTSASLRFVREKDAWHLDLMPLMAEGSRMLEAQARRAGAPEDDVLLMVIERLSGRRPDASIWQPLE
jgi:hypothetical protein